MCPQVRHRIEHCRIATDLTIKRVKELGLVPTPQGQFLRELGGAYLHAIGPDRGRLLCRQKSFLDAGVVAPGVSDGQVVDGAPLRGIHALVSWPTSRCCPTTCSCTTVRFVRTPVHDRVGNRMAKYGWSIAAR